MALDVSKFNNIERKQYVFGLLDSLDKSAEEYYDDVTRLHHDDSYLEFEYSKGRRNYDRIINRLINSEFDDPNEQAVYKTTLKKIKPLLHEVLIKTLGKSEEERIIYYLSLIKPEKQPTIYDVPTEYDKNREVLGFYPDDGLDEIEMLPLARMITDALLSKHREQNFNTVYGNKNYTYLIPHLMQYIMAVELQGKVKNEDMYERHEQFFLHELKTGTLYKEKIEKTLNDAEKITTEFQKNIRKIEFTKRRIEILKRMLEHQHFRNVINDVYATALIEKYKEDPAVMCVILEAILKGQKGILDLLRYYGVSMKERSTYELYDNKITKYLAR